MLILAFEFVNEMTFLGVVLEERLDFGCHIQYLYSKVTSSFRSMYCTNIYLLQCMRNNYYCIEVVYGTSLHIFNKKDRLFNMVLPLFTD